jgi:isopentenyl-diphosphate Delta-isomerase
VRSGLDAARALTLGATLVGMGYPFLKAASEGLEAVRTFLDAFLAELAVAMQLAGAADVAALARLPLVVTGPTREWLAQHGFDDVVRGLAQRGR